ncbi:hypothetical protein FACS1894166_02740 [Bacilli bacterium]|nr:hypothetical protein FACS1894166_02740 [Bacilli bacterium]
MSSSYLSVHNIETNKDKDFFNFLSKLQDDSHQDIRKKFLMTDAKKLTLIQKEKMAIERIKDFLNRCDAEGKVPVISFSGGKDSCVVRHLVSRVRKGIKCETAAELFHPEIASFLRTIPKNEITLFAPTMPFEQIIKEEGYPVLSKEVAQKVNNVRNCVTLGK